MDDAQTILASANSPLGVSRPHIGWSEQDPADWITATKTALNELRATHPGGYGAIRGIGISGHMHGATLIDADGNVLRPCMLWNDTRSYREAAELDRDPAFQEISGNIVFPGFTAPKVMWVKNHEPEIFNRIAKILLPKDYLGYWLTGETVSEMSDASGTSWLDVKQRNWSQRLLVKCGLTLDHMPRLVEGTQTAGRLRVDLVSELGLAGDVTVAGGAGDNAASAVGMGAVEAGDGFLSLGTSGVLFAVNDRYSPNAESAVHAFCHAIPDTWHQMGVILSATDALNWLSSVTGKSPGELDHQLPDVVGSPSGLTFLPYLSGERTPHNDANVRGVFAGLHHEADTVTLTKAVLEGVTFAFRDCLDALAVAGTRINRVTAVGGGSRSRYWLQLLANVLDVKIDIPKDGDFGAAFGAARLGLMAAEGAEAQKICTRPAISMTIEPNLNQRDEYARALETYRALYPAIKALDKTQEQPTVEEISS